MMFVGSVTYPAALLSISVNPGLLTEDEKKMEKIQEDDELLHNLATPSCYDALLGGAGGEVESNVSRMKEDVGYLAGVLRVWGNIVDDNPRSPQMRMASLGLFLGGPSGHLTSDGASTVPGFDAPKAKRSSSSEIEKDWYTAVLIAGFIKVEPALVKAIAESALEAVTGDLDASLIVSEGNSLTVKGSVPTTITSLLRVGEDLVTSIDDLDVTTQAQIAWEVIRSRGGSSFMVSGRILEGPAQPMPFNYSINGKKKEIANEVPQSRLESDGRPKVYPIAIGFRADPWRYPTKDERKAKARELGLIGGAPKDDADTGIDPEDTEDEDSISSEE